MRARILLTLLAILALASPCPAIQLPGGDLAPPDIHRGRDGNQTQNGTDTTPPVISITSHADRSEVKDRKVILGGSASDSGTGVAWIRVRVNNGDWLDVRGNSSWNIELSLRDGANTVTAQASDLAGNTAESTVTITYPTARGSNSGIILAFAVVLPVIFLLVYVALRLRRRPPAGEPPDGAPAQPAEDAGEEHEGKA